MAGCSWYGQLCNPRMCYVPSALAGGRQSCRLWHCDGIGPGRRRSLAAFRPPVRGTYFRNSMQMCAARRDVCFDFQAKKDEVEVEDGTPTRKTSSRTCGLGGDAVGLVWQVASFWGLGYGSVGLVGLHLGDWWGWEGQGVGEKGLLAVATHERAAKRASREKSVDKNSNGSGNRRTLGPKENSSCTCWCE